PCFCGIRSRILRRPQTVRPRCGCLHCGRACGRGIGEMVERSAGMKSDIDKMRERVHDAREVLALLDQLQQARQRIVELERKGDEAHGRWAYWRERREEGERENEELRGEVGICKARAEEFAPPGEW